MQPGSLAEGHCTQNLSGDSPGWLCVHREEHHQLVSGRIQLSHAMSRVFPTVAAEIHAERWKDNSPAQYTHEKHRELSSMN